MVTLETYRGQIPPWCPGCGNFAILKAFKDMLVELQLEPHQITVVSGIGQAAKLPHYTRCNTFNGLHGRALPVATGIRLANHAMPVIVTTGDGDCYGEGGNHLLAAIRRNINVKLFVHNNQIYGLTKGQPSPTTSEGTKAKNVPSGVISEQFNPMALAVALDCGFAARAFAADTEHLKGLMKEAMNHQGFLRSSTSSSLVSRSTRLIPTTGIVSACIILSRSIILKTAWRHFRSRSNGVTASRSVSSTGIPGLPLRSVSR